MKTTISRATRPFLLALALFFGVSAFGQSCTTEFDWSILGLADEDGAPPFYSTTINGVTVTLSWSFTTDGDSVVPYAGLDYVSYDAGFVSLTDSSYLSLGLDNDLNDPDDVINVTLSFSPPVEDLAFTLYDIDNQSDTIVPPAWMDAIELFYNGGTNIKTNPAFYVAGASLLPDDETYMDGFEGTNGDGTATTNGDMNVDFGATAISSISLNYFTSDDATTNPGGQFMGFGKLSWQYDTNPPVLIGVPANTTADCASIPAPPTVTAADDCDPSPTVTFSETATGGIITRTWTATDGTGNQTTQSQTITTNDSNNPVLVGVPSDTTIDCNDVNPPITSAGPTPAYRWTFDELAGSSTTDVIASEVGTFSGGVALAPGAGRADGGVLFDGVDGVITTSNIDLSGDELTISAWIKLADLNSVQARIISKANGTASSTHWWMLSLITYDDLRFRVKTSSGSTVEMFTNSDVLTVGQWHFVNAVYDGSQMLIYLDGVEVASASQSGTISEDPTIPVGIGNQPIGFGSRPFSGVIDELRLYEDALTPTLINEIYAEGLASVSATDACDPAPVVTFSEVVGTGCPYTITRTWTATDASGNSVSDSQVVTVTDNTDPVLVGVPADVSVDCGSIPTPPTVTATDDCTASPTVNFSETTSPGCPYTITRTWTATDDCGNSSSQSQVISVSDNTNPVLVGVPANVSVDCGSIPTPATVTATDDCAASPSISFNETTGTGCPYTITRTWTATDDCGNSISASQVITVDDNTSPVLSGVPANISVDCENVPAAATVTATDNCDAAPTVSFIENIVPGCPYFITRTWIGSDNCGNSISATQTITVIDTVAPVVISGPADFNTDCSSSLPAPPDPTVSDNCDTSLTIDFVETVTGTCPKVSTRVWTITDDCGNFTTHTQVVNFIDNTPPVITGVPANTTVLCTSVPAVASVSATDDCDTAVNLVFTETYSEGCPIMITRKWVATDVCGNSDSAIQVITAIDILDPVLSGVPGDTTVNCITDVPPPAAVTATDGCDPTISFFFNESPTASGLQRLWTAIDDCGNSTLAIQNITILGGGSDPTLSGVPADVVLDCASVPGPAVVIGLSSSGDTLPVNFTEVVVEGCPKIITRTWDVTDNCGNNATASQVITATDNTAPVLSAYPMDTNITCGDAIPVAPTIIATDDCDATPEISFTENFIGFDSIGDCDYSILRIWNAMDTCSNAVLHSQVITINPLVPTPPIAVNDNLTVNEDGGGSVDLSANDIDADGDLDPTSVNLLTTLPTGQGVLTNNGDGTVTFVPAPDYDGLVDPVFYTISDAFSATDTGILSITIVPQNDPPVAGTDFANVCFGGSIDIPVLANDMDIDDGLDPTSLTIVTFPVSGTATAMGSGIIEFVQDGLTTAPNIIQYTIADVGGQTVTGTVNVLTIAPPTISAAPADDTVVCGSVPAAATLSATDYFGASLTVNFTENLLNYAGPADCDYQVERIWTATDSCGNSATASQLIYVVPGANVAPTVLDDSEVICYGASIVVNVLANDSDSDGTIDPTSVALTGGVSGGIATVNVDGTISFDHDGVTSGPISIGYSVADDQGATGTATLTINLHPEILLSGQRVNATCGQTDGSIDLSVSGGTPPFSFLWSSGETTEDISGLGTGAYDVTVTDLAGCTAVASFFVSEESNIVLAGVTTFPASSCTSTDGSVLIDLDDANAGVPPYVISINNTYTFGPFASEPIILFGAPGRAKVNNIRVTDATGCEVIDQGTYPIGEPDPPAVASITINDPVCGVDTVGSIVIDLVDSLSGGPNYFVKLSNQVYGPFGSEPLVIDNLPPGDYQKPKVRDGNGCIFKGTGVYSIADCPPLRAELPLGADDLIAYRNVWPNPTSGPVNVAMELNLKADVAIQVLNVQGEVVFETNFEGVESLAEGLDLSILASGVYTVKWIINNERIYLDKLVRIN